MIYPPLLLIQKKTFWSSGFSRWYTKDKVVLNPDSKIKTEKQFCLWLLQKHGEGTFMVLAYVKRRKGCYVFWIGDIHRNGFRRNCKTTGWVHRLDDQKLGINRNDYENDSYWNERDEQIEKYRSKVRKKRRGVSPYLVPSKPGSWYDFEGWVGWDE